MPDPGRYELDPAEVFDHVLVLIPSRHRLCGYESHTDCCRDLTKIDIMNFTRKLIIHGEVHDGDLRIRSLVVGNKRIYGLWGFPAEVSSLIQFSFDISIRSRDHVCLFVIGACWA